MDEQTKWVPVTPAEKAAIRRELDDVLAAPSFANSKRYPAFLRYVVEKVLHGQTDELKERTLGIEIFHRAPDYDSNNDTIVRVTAGEVRRRLADYYHRTGAEHSIQISLPLGSYVPEFFRVEPDVLETESPIAATPNLGQNNETSEAVSQRRRPLWQLLAISSVAAMLAVLLAWWVWRQSTIDRFWKDLGATTVILSPGTIVTSGTPPAVQLGDSTHDSVWVSVESNLAIARITRMLGIQRREFAIQPAASLTLTDLRTHPVVLIGGFNNNWTLRLTDNLRFHFCPKNAGRYFVDRENPGKIWQSHSNAEERILDYALVAKYHDPLTDKMVYVVAGLNKGGTDAASEFVTSKQYLDLLRRQLPRGWENRNIEVILETHSFGNKNSAPQIVATHVW
jgi:hypothetical protein